ncbi:mannose 6-phosphate receptor domain-containing protein [Rhodotorula sp. JG-1b]|nr:mannose 6-phosphate receptor domain-containing protein [Rhodotorula sp. JG-1b]
MRVAASRRAHRCAGASSSPLVVAAFTALASASVALAASSTPCVIQGSSIGKFDLRGLRNKKHDYVASNPDGGAISLNFCGPVSDQASPVEAAQGYGAYIEDTRGGISLGEYSHTPSYHNGQLSMTYKNGATCPNSNAKRSSLIYLECDNTWIGSSNKVTLIDSIDDCNYFFVMKTPYACPVSGGGFFGAIWSIIVSLFWIAVLVGGGIFAYRRFFAKRGGQTPGGSGSDGNGLAGVVGTLKDGVVVAGIWIIDVVQNVFNAVNSRRGGSRGGDYNYNYNYQPAPVAPQRANTGPDYSSPAWQASSAASGDAAPPAPPAKSTSTREPHNPLAGGGSLLEDEEDEDEDEATLAMPGTQQLQQQQPNGNGNGKSAGSLV